MPIDIDPTKFSSRSEGGRFLHGFLKQCQDDPRAYRYRVLFKNTEYEYCGHVFTLTHTLHCRNIVVDNHEVSRYLVVSTPPGKEGYVARGNQGSIAYYAGVLHPLLDTMLYVPDYFGGNRLYKNTRCMDYSQDGVRYQEQELHTEWTYATLGEKLFPKKLFTFAGEKIKKEWGFYYYMRRAEGCSLTDFLKKEAQRQHLDQARLIKISLALIQALYFQVTRHNVVHCDIKPDNIFIAENPESQTFSATILDYGFAMSKFDTAQRVQGTLKYLPPEYINEQGKIKYEAVHHLKFDVYSLGKVLKRVWKGACEPETKVRAILDSALSINPDVRPDLTSLYDAFLALGGFSEDIKQANLLGQRVRLQIDDFKNLRSQSDQNKQEKEKRFIACIRDSLAALQDNSEAVQAYISGLGWDALILARYRYDLPGESPKAILLRHIENILEKRRRAVATLEKAKQQLENTHIKFGEDNKKYFLSFDSYAAICNAFKALAEKYNKRIAKMKDLPLDLDELSIKTDRLVYEMASVGELHDLIHLKINKPDGTPWVFPEESDDYQAAGNSALVDEINKIMTANIDHYEEQVKAKINILLASRHISFEEKRDRLVRFFAVGKYQKMYVELCIAEKNSPVYVVEPYFILLTSLESIHNEDMDSAFLKLIAQAIREYLSAVSDDRNLNLLYRAASKNRLEDIRKIQELIHLHPNHNDFLVGLKAVVAGMKSGPLGKSLLKDKLSAAIKQYEGDPEKHLSNDRLTPVIENHERRKQKMPKATKMINVTALNKVPDVALNRCISQFLKEQIRVKGNFIIFADHEYLFKGQKLVFSNELVVSQGRGDEAGELSFSVINGIIDNKDEGATQLYDVCGYLELMPGDGCVYRSAPSAEVLRHYSRDIRLPEAAMNAAFQARYAVLDALYQQKKVANDPSIPPVGTKFKTTNIREKEAELSSLFVLQKGTSLANFLKVQGPLLSDDDRVRLTNSLLAAYRDQVRDANGLLGYVDLNRIMIAVDEVGQYQFDLIGDGLHQAPDGVLNLPVTGSPHFIHPEGVKLKHALFQANLNEDITMGVNRRTDEWGIGRVLCEVWDENQSLKSWSQTKYLELYREKYDLRFEDKALQKIQTKENSRGFLRRFVDGLKARFFPYKTTQDKIKAKLTYDERVAIQQEVESELSYEMAREMPAKLSEFCQGLNVPAQVKHTLNALLSSKGVEDNVFKEAKAYPRPRAMQRGEKAPPVNAEHPKDTLQKIAEACSNMCFKYKSYMTRQPTLRQWAGLINFQEELTNFRKVLGPYNQPRLAEVERIQNDWMRVQHDIQYCFDVNSLRSIQKASAALCSQAALYFHNSEKFDAASSPWHALKAFNERLTGCFVGENDVLAETNFNYCFDQWKQIKASIDEELKNNARLLSVIYLRPGSDYAKSLFAYLKSQVDNGVTWFDAGHVFLDENGVVYRLSHALDVREKPNGQIHYDVLEPFRLAGNASADQTSGKPKVMPTHSSIYKVAYVLKPGLNDDLICVKRLDEAQRARRFVKRNMYMHYAQPRPDENEVATWVADEFAALEKVGASFKPKNLKASDHTFSQKRQPGSGYTGRTNIVDVDDVADLSDREIMKRKHDQGLALVRAFYVQVELNKIKYTDVKPSNIILNTLPNGEHVFSVIDFEEDGKNYYSFPPLAKFQGETQPEKLKNLNLFLAERHLLFGLGVLLAQLYLDQDELFGKDNEERYLGMSSVSRYDNVRYLVDRHLPEHIRTIIQDLLSLDGPHQINNVSDLLNRLHNASRSSPDVVLAYRAGCDLRFSMKQMVSEDGVIQSITEALLGVNTAEPAVIQAFVRGLGFAALLKGINDIKTLRELTDGVRNIFNKKLAIKQGWEAKKEALTTLAKASDIDPGLLSRPQKEALQLALREVHLKTGYVDEHDQVIPGNIEAHYSAAECDLDVIDEAHTRLLGYSMQEFDRVHRSSVQSAKSLASQAQAILLRQALAAEENPLKQACVTALADYTKEKGGLISERRSRDISALKDIITTAQNTETLKTSVEHYVKGTLSGGLFGRNGRFGGKFKGKLAASLLNAVKGPAMRG